MVLTRHGAVAPGIYEATLDLAALFPDRIARSRFETRWEGFWSATSDHADLFMRDGDRLVYHTESFLPSLDDARVPVLLVFGNPASQSVCAGMCFAFERGMRGEHRFWRALRATGWLTFHEDVRDDDVASRNARRRDLLLGGGYESPFAIGIDVFFSFPSPASTPKWAGVAGLTALFGRTAMGVIAAEERQRLALVVRSYARSGMAVVAFQRDAYDGLRDATAPEYAAPLARTGSLRSPSAAGVPVPVFAAPPTRLSHTPAFLSVLRQYRDEITARALP